MTTRPHSLRETAQALVESFHGINGGSELWENNTLEAFLQGMLDFTASCPNYYRNDAVDIELGRVHWHVFAEILYKAAYDKPKKFDDTVTSRKDLVDKPKKFDDTVTSRKDLVHFIKRELLYPLYNDWEKTLPEFLDRLSRVNVNDFYTKDLQQIDSDYIDKSLGVFSDILLAAQVYE